MVEGVRPVAQLFVVGFLHLAALIQRVAEIVVTLGLQTSIRREQCLTERFQRLIVILQFVGRGA